VLSPLLLLALWYRRTRARPGRLRRLANRFDARKAFVAIGIALHVGILSLLEVGPFSLISVAYYLCLLRPEEARRLVLRLTRRELRARVADAAQGGTVAAGKAPPEAA
jgi:hypothetical protein